MWEFIVPEDEEEVNQSSSNDKHAEFRPQRMGLGCSTEMIQEKISENAKKSRLTKLLKRAENANDDAGNATSSKLKRSRLEDDSDDELSKSLLVSKKAITTASTAPIPVVASALSKSQRKRMKQKIKAEQKKHMNS